MEDEYPEKAGKLTVELNWYKRALVMITKKPEDAKIIAEYALDFYRKE